MLNLNIMHNDLVSSSGWSITKSFQGLFMVFCCFWLKFVVEFGAICVLAKVGYFIPTIVRIWCTYFVSSSLIVFMEVGTCLV